MFAHLLTLEVASQFLKKPPSFRRGRRAELGFSEGAASRKVAWGYMVKALTI